MIRFSRRQFLRIASAAVISSATVQSFANEMPKLGAGTEDRKVIVILFGGGARSIDTLDDPQHRWIPRLWNEMIPQGALFSNMRVERRVVHPNSAGSIVTGHWEYDHLDWSVPVAHPTIFEIGRKARRSPDTSAWVFAYASILAGMGESQASDLDSDLAANVVIPPTIPRTTAQQMDTLLGAAASRGNPQVEYQAAQQCARLARTTSRMDLSRLRSPSSRQFIERQYEAWKSDSGTTSHDAFLAQAAIGCMETFQPDMLAVAFGEIDCAHYGSWSRYTAAIARTDALVASLWDTAQRIESYRGKTLMIVLPDHGRQLDTPGSAGFIHHGDFYTDADTDEGCRRIWMWMAGPGVKPGLQIDRPLPITSVAATSLEYLGLDPSIGSAESVWNFV